MSAETVYDELGTLPGLEAFDTPEVIDISVVMPCLHEEASVGTCVTWALEGIARTGLRGEVIVADNGLDWCRARRQAHSGAPSAP